VVRPGPITRAGTTARLVMVYEVRADKLGWWALTRKLCWKCTTQDDRLGCEAWLIAKAGMTVRLVMLYEVRDDKLGW
jgi:hypothetical protein